MAKLPQPFDDYIVDTDKAHFDYDAAWDWLHNHAYWGKTRTRPEMDVQFDNSFMVFGLFDRDGKMVGAARAIGEPHNLAYLSDVYILESVQGKGLGKAFLGFVLNAEGRKKWSWVCHASRMKDWYVKYFDFYDIGKTQRMTERGLNHMLERVGKIVYPEEV